MSKILLVEDDNNLREIYEARLQAEGYEIVTARDGEEALTVAMKERPDLIISDVMMPKISGFDMLDIIRSTEETKNSKVIMMTALSQAEDKERATKLGADRYLVKSQVTLEDVAKVAREVLEGEAKEEAPNVQSAPSPAPQPQLAPTVAPVVDPTPQPAAPAPVTEPTQQADDSQSTASDSSQTANDVATALSVDPAQAVMQAAPMVAPATDNSSAADDNATSQASDIEPLGQSVKDEQAAIAAQIESFIESKKTSESTDPETNPAPSVESEFEAAPTEEAGTETPAETAPVEQPSESQSESSKKKVIHPINDITQSSGPNLDALLEKEHEKERMAEIAREISAKKPASDVSEELSAEAALREASRQPKPATEENSNPGEVKIAEDGSLQLPTSGQVEEQASLPQPPQTPQPSDDPAVEVAPQPVAPVESSVEPETELQYEEQPVEQQTSEQVTTPQPVIPHTNGTSIDGVSQQPPAASPQQNPIPAAPTSTGFDPNSIAL